MIDYLNDYLTLEEFRIIKLEFTSKDKNNFDIAQHNIREVLDYLRSVGVYNFKDLLLYRRDVCFKDINLLKEDMNKIKLELVVKLFNEDVSALINLNI